MSGECTKCGHHFDYNQWKRVGTTGPSNWAGAPLYRCPSCGAEQTRPYGSTR